MVDSFREEVYWGWTLKVSPGSPGRKGGGDSQQREQNRPREQWEPRQRWEGQDLPLGLPDAGQFKPPVPPFILNPPSRLLSVSFVADFALIPVPVRGEPWLGATTARLQL